jgi:hypothetical protein
VAALHGPVASPGIRVFSGGRPSMGSGQFS